MEVAKQAELTGTLEDFWQRYGSDDCLAAAKIVLTRWTAAGHRHRVGPGTNYVVLMAAGPSVGGQRTGVAIYPDGHVLVPFGSYGGQNSGIAIDALTTDHFRTKTNPLFGFAGTEKQARTAPGWLTLSTQEAFFAFCDEVAAAYADAQPATLSDE